MSLPYWEYFLSIESDLESCSKYVDFSTANYTSYSVEFAKIILTASAEIDTISKEICKLIDPNSNAGNIVGYKTQILTRYPNLTTLEIEMPRYSLVLKPWDEWNTQNSPSWWQEYNDIKHDRTANFSKANLKNALHSVSGLFTIILYYYDAKFSPQKPNIDAFFSPRLFSPKAQEQSGFIAGGIYWDYSLPG